LPFGRQLVRPDEDHVALQIRVLGITG
jgi:hypothetical protein